MRRNNYELGIGSEIALRVGVLAGIYFPLVGGIALANEAMYDKNEAREYVEDAGYTDVEYLDTDRFFLQVTGCGRDDTIKYEFKAIAPNTNREVRLDVCDGIFKGATIRQDN